MGEFQNPMLLTTDPDEPGAALARLLSLPVPSDARLTILAVALPEPVGLAVDAKSTPTLERLVEREVEHLRAHAEALARTASRAGYAVDVRIERGNPLWVAVDIAVRNGHDLLLKTVEAGDGFGPLDRQLLRNCPCPVWIEQAGPLRPLRRVLVAVNPDPDAPEDCALAGDLLRSAATVADGVGAELNVLHAWKIFGERIPLADEPADPELAPLIGATLNRHMGYLTTAIEAAGLAGSNVRRHLIHQRASVAIATTVRELHPDLLVMGTVGRTGIPGFVIGNTAERVLSNLTCSLLARKPTGFVSPMLTS
ncbi:MAG TPA: universal stress protein [Myxococcota bacterium]|nr:universal stress protein [Myxococcota bacterium]